MNKSYSLIVLSTTICLLLGGSVALASDNKVFSEGTVSTITKKNTYQEPWYVRNDDPDYVAYGIEADTWNGTDDAPKVQLIGTKGNSEILSLDNKPDNFGGGKDYFIFSGRDIGDVGIPIGIKFTADGDNGWGMQNVKVDYFIIPEPETKWREAASVPGWWSQFTNTNDRNKIRTTLKGYFDKLMVTKKPIKMAGKRGVDGNEESDGGIKFKKDVILSAVGSKLNSFRNGGSQTVDLSAEVIVIDTRKSAVDITWQSTQKQTVTADEVRGAINSSSHETGWNNTTTVGVKVGGKTGVKDVSEKSVEFSLENSFSVHETNIKAAQDSNSKNLSNSYSSSSGQSYLVAAGSVAFIELKRTATVTRYTDFAEMQRIGPSISVQYFLTPRYYQTECSTGKLRLINAYHKKAGEKASFSFGAYLDDPSQSKYLKAAKAGFGGGFNASAPLGENCSS